MKLLDFSNRQNRDVRVEDVGEEYIKVIHQKTISDPWYPKFHIAPPHGLLNDPNGLYEKDGVYHIFYQWFPLGPVHGLKHWYHLTTKDFINYEDLGVGIAPEDNYDFTGCYTGMTFEKKDIFYTGIDVNKLPAVCYATIDERKIEKKGVIIPLDENITTINFRDPFVFKKDDYFLVLVGGEDLENKGIIPVYKSFDNFNYDYIGNLKLKDYPFGYMLECPNYFEEDGKGVLFFSPQGIESPNKYDFRNVFSVVYMIGAPIDDSLNFNGENIYEMDKGFDFYAPQIFKDEKNRNILYAWLGNSKCEYPSDKNQWAHMLTIPREIEISQDRIIQKPLAELKELRKDQEIISERFDFQFPSHEIEIEEEKNFIFKISNELGENITFQMTDDEFILDRSSMSHLYDGKFGYTRFAKRLVKEKQKIRIFVDSSSIEIFADNGYTTLTARYYIDNPNSYILKGTTGKIWELSEIKIPYKY